MKKILAGVLASLCLVLTGWFASRAMPPKNDVRPGMKIEDATRVTKNSIQAASGIEPEEIRPEDSLEFLGITDELRLDALRRYLIRNAEIGVQSVWGVHSDEIFARQFIIGKSALSKMDKSWTVEKLAATIREKAGLPRLPYSRSARVVADCRLHVENLSNQLPTADPVTIRRVREFVDCIVTDEEHGVPSSGISAPTGETYTYQFIEPSQYKAIMEDCINRGQWRYERLIRFISDYAEVNFSPEMTASQMVVNAILEIRVGSLRTRRAASTSFVLSEVLPIPGGTRITEEKTLRELGVDPADLKVKLMDMLNPRIIDVEGCGSRHPISQALRSRTKTNVASQQVVFATGDLNAITRETKLRDVIDIVAKLISK